MQMHEKRKKRKMQTDVAAMAVTYRKLSYKNL